MSLRRASPHASTIVRGEAGTGKQSAETASIDELLGCFARLVDEAWQSILGSLEPIAACQLRLSGPHVCQSVDGAATLLCAERLRLPCALSGLAPSEALCTYWRARPGAPVSDLTKVVHLAGERGLVAFLLDLALRLGRRARFVEPDQDNSSEEDPTMLDRSEPPGPILSKEGAAPPLLDLVDAHGLTVLHTAAASGQAAAVRALCNLADSSVDDCNSGGVFKALARQTARKRTVLHCAAAFGDIQTLDAVLESIAVDECQDLLVSLDRRLRSAALIAYSEGHRKAAHHLVQAHGSFAAPAVHRAVGTDLLVAASESCDTGMVTTLLAKRADINGARPIDDLTPLMAVAIRGVPCIEVMDILFQHPDLNVNLHEKRSGRSALHFACQNGHAVVMERLLDRGAVCTAEAPGARSPLYLAAERGNIECVESLLPYVPAGDLYRTTARFSTPIQVAERRGHWAVARRLATFAESSGASSRAPSPPVFIITRDISPDQRQRPRSAGSGARSTQNGLGSRNSLHGSTNALGRQPSPRRDDANPSAAKMEAAETNGRSQTPRPKTPPKQRRGDGRGDANASAARRRQLRLGPAAARSQSSHAAPQAAPDGVDVEAALKYDDGHGDFGAGASAAAAAALVRQPPAADGRSCYTPRRRRSSSSLRALSGEPSGRISIAAWEAKNSAAQSGRTPRSPASSRSGGPSRRERGMITEKLQTQSPRSTWEQRAAMHRLSAGGRVTDLRQTLAANANINPSTAVAAAAAVALNTPRQSGTPRRPPLPGGGMVMFGAFGGA